MIRLSGTQRELMEIIWEGGEMTLHDIVKSALGNAVTMNRTDAVRVVLMQMVTKGAIEENKEVSPHLFKALVGRDEVGYETSFASGAGEGSALLTAFSSGGLGGLGGGIGAQVETDQPQGPRFAATSGAAAKQNPNQREAVKQVMEQVCRERDEYEAEKARKKAESEKKD